MNKRFIFSENSKFSILMEKKHNFCSNSALILSVLPFFENIKHLFKNLTPTIFKFIYYLHFKKRTNSLAHSPGSINYFEVWHLKIQDGRQLNMQIRWKSFFGLLLTWGSYTPNLVIIAPLLKKFTFSCTSSLKCRSWSKYQQCRLMVLLPLHGFVIQKKFQK